MADSTHREAWQAHARSTARRWNTAWWLDFSALPLIIVGVLSAAAILWLRRDFPHLPLPWLIGGAVGLIALTTATCALLAKRRFVSFKQALVRMEAAMRLNNALSAAEAGVAAWPAAPQRVQTNLQWQPLRIVIPWLGALALPAAALLIPLAAKPPATAHEQPQSWKAMEQSLDLLEQEQVVEKPYIEQMREKLNELKSKDEDEWFSHASLEATDSMKQAHREELQHAEKQLEQAAHAIEAADANADREAQQKLGEEFEQALKGLEQGAMKPNSALMEQLKQLDPKQLGQLSPEQAKQLKENLKQAADNMNKAGQKCEGDGSGSDWSEEMLANDHQNDGSEGQGAGQGDGKGNGNGSGEPGDGNDDDGTGQGGPGPGGGHADGVLGKESQRTNLGDIAGVESQDLSKSLPGDLLELQNGKHDVDQTKRGPAQGGDTKALGEGGERVWRHAFDPEEQRTLKRFFNER